MNCSKENLMIGQSDFQCIGQVSEHCDLPKLYIAIQEAQNFDLENLFCSFWLEIIKWNNVVTSGGDFSDDFNNDFTNEELGLLNNLICGGNYLGCNGETRRHYGIKRILTYYAYARYIIINPFNDTPNGTVQKTNESSMPIPLKELQSFSDKYRTMAYESYMLTADFLCVNRGLFKNFNSKDCKSCGCGSRCDSQTKAKGYGFKSKIISKI